MIKIGTNPIAWSNDDLHELGGNTPLEDCLMEAAQAGFSGIELGHKFPREVAPLREALTPYDLELISGWYSAQLLVRSVEEEYELLKPHLDLLKAMGSHIVIWAETTACIHGDRDIPLSEKPVVRAPEWSDFCDKMTLMGDLLLKEGMCLAYHHHMGTVIQDKCEIQTLMEKTGPSVGLLLDTGHLTFAGVSIDEICDQYLDRIVHVHCKDVRSEVLARCLGANSSFLDAVIEGVFTVPGDGSVDFPAVLQRLRVSGYDRWLVIEAEQDPDVFNPLEYAQLGYKNLSRMASEAGLEIFCK